jgi:DNA processing protein
MDELSAWLTLSRAPGLHAGILRPLLEHLPSAASLVAASPTVLRALSASDTLIEWLQVPQHHDVSAEQRWLTQKHRHFIPWGDDRYPPLLANVPDAPIALYVRGDPALLALPQLAIVGSRNPTPAGRENAAAFAAHLSNCGLAITSGLAIGIDAASHRGALDAGGATIAVCGTGLDVNYPRSNAALAEEIAERGALVSEFHLGAPAVKSNFPRRNRVISGLSLGVLVVEAALKSGSLITARLASEQGREVFAIPGAIHNALARGCHQLIRQGAKLVETADDIFTEIRTLAGALTTAPRAGAADPSRKKSGAALDKEYEILLDALGFEPASVDVLIARSGLRADAVASMLLILELDGRIESYPGGLYVQRAHHDAAR